VIVLKARHVRLGAASAALGALLSVTPARAQYANPPERPAAAGVKPAILERVGIDQKIGQQLPLDLRFKDDEGKDVRLGDYFGGKPVVLALAYYECPMLCTQVLNGMTSALKELPLNAGSDYEVVVVSINPKEAFRLAQVKKAMYVKDYGRPQTAAGWHFLTGTEPAIASLASAIGFRYAYDESLQQYAHAAAVYVATPKGVVARYLMGIDYPSRDLRLAIVEASNNQLGSVADKVLLLCYHYDPMTGKYGAATLNAVRVGFIATVGGFLTFLFVSLRAERAASGDRR
jgi:protein SCO1/2